MALSPGQKKVAIGLLIAFIVWKFWTAPEELADSLHQVGGVLSSIWDRLSRFMNAFDQ